MSISPTGLRQRRARMRKPLAMRNAAARLSAEMPVRNAILPLRMRRIARGIGSARRSSLMVALLGERQRALIDVAPRGAGDGATSATASLTDRRRERGAQERVEFGLAAASSRGGGPMTTITISPRGSAASAARAQRRRARRAAPPRTAWSARGRSPPRAPPGPRRGRRAPRRGAGRSRTGRGSPECASSSAMRARRAPLLRRQESLEEEAVGRKARTVSAASTAEAPGSAVTACPAARARAPACSRDRRPAACRHRRPARRRRPRRAAPAASAAPPRHCARDRASAAWRWP